MRSTPAPNPSAHPRRLRRPAAIALGASLLLLAPACSDDADPVAERAEDATSAPQVADACPEAQAFVDSLDDLLGSNVVEIGTDGLKERILAVSDAWEALRPAAAAAHEEETDAVVEAVRDLRSVDLANGAGRAVAAYSAALGEVGEAWSDLRAEIRADLDGCDLSSEAAPGGS
jgi:hypothetical protein